MNDAVVEIVNLTGQPVSIQKIDKSGVATISGNKDLFSRLLEPQDPGDDNLVGKEPTTVSGIEQPIQIVTLHVDHQARNLPEPRVGTLYLVPQVAAFLAPYRADLIYPHYETLGEPGAAEYADGFGRYVRERRSQHLRRISATFIRTAISAWRTPRDTIGRSTPVVWAARRDWVIGLAFTVANVMVSASLGWMTTLSAHSDRTPLSFGLGWAILISGLLALLFSVLAWWKRDNMRRVAGTAYVISEESRDWTRVERSVYVRSLSRVFENVIEVTGPSVPGLSWSWGYRREDGRKWSANVDRLVWSVIVSAAQDRRESPNVLFVWAAWPVAMALTQRLRGVERSLAVLIGRRPSFGRGGVFKAPTDPKSCLEFAPQDDNPDLSQVSKLTLKLDLRSDRYCAAPGATPCEPGDKSPPLQILLVRMTNTSFGKKEGREDPSTEPPDSICVVDASDCELVFQALAGWNGKDVPFYELRLQPTDGRSQEWDHFESLAWRAAKWIEKMTCDKSGPVVSLLATLIPQEIGPGIGLISWGLKKWPEHLWPLVVPSTDQPFIIPSIDLGRAAFSSARVAR